ncbi:MAG: response regulator transcription factor [Herbiconiux sp.]|uniref:LuxR C-terminal-related transcriptional regulator n=1 Tax=Herbiconiux sp. TaxID=1871186 RepID=UPI001219912E|nr:response regulator transcription factor [Herbiconiux sp.]TAJ48519.1 MAG: response regulator transcription factor [Herbiconiux sp.]
MNQRVAIVDDHEVVSLAVGTLITAHCGLDFSGSATSVTELIAAGARADLVVLDLNLRDGSTPSGNVDRLRHWGAEVLAFTSGENPYLVREVSRSAALGIVRKSAPPAQIIDAIATAANGGIVVTTEWAAALDSDPELRTAPLTEREREVLALYASGLGARAVALELRISENTVDDHIRRIRSVYRQLGRPAHSKVDLYRRGLEDGYLPLPTGS